MLENITLWLIGLLDSMGYLGIFFAAAIESFFAPIPSEIILFTAGLYARANGGMIELLLISFVAALGSFLGTLPFYLIARFSANKLLPKFLDRWGAILLITEKDLRRTEGFFSKYGSWAVFIFRLLPVGRSLISLPAGVAKMNFLLYTVFTIAGSFSWNLILVAIGFWAYDYKDQVFSFLKPVEAILTILILLIALVYISMVVGRIVILNSKK